eukprot:g1469.t1
MTILEPTEFTSGDSFTCEWCNMTMTNPKGFETHLRLCPKKNPDGPTLKQLIRMDPGSCTTDVKKDN